MYIEKKVIGSIPRCYAVTPLYYKGKDHLLVASEKCDRCVLYDMEGNEEETVWTEPGGVMTMLQIPGTDGEFLATHKFYSPNEAEEAKIIIATPKQEGGWDIHTLIDLPFVHRFGILERNHIKYLIACTVKSGQKHTDNDWSFPGKVYGAVLPEDFSGFDDQHQLNMDVLMDGMVKNHGYYKIYDEGTDKAVISCDSGVYTFAPPEQPGGKWVIEQLLDTPASDAVPVDLDGDGVQELAVISPFHGDHIAIYRKNYGKYEKAYDYDRPAEFSHAIFGGLLDKVPAVVIGHREGERNLIVFTWNAQKKEYMTEFIDRDCGSANVYKFTYQGADYLLSANREINEVALYKVRMS